MILHQPKRNITFTLVLFAIAALAGCTRSQPVPSKTAPPAPAQAQKAAAQPTQDPRIQFLDRYIRVAMAKDYDKRSEQVRFFSRDYLIQNKINIQAPGIDGIVYDSHTHHIIDIRGEYFDIEHHLIPGTCPNCIDKTPDVTRYRIISQGDGFAILPAPQKGRGTAPYWQHFTGSKAAISHEISPVAQDDPKLAFLNSYWNYLLHITDSNKDRLKRIEFFSPSYFKENDIDPFFMEFNGWPFDKFKVVGRSGNYYDTEIDCNICSTRMIIRTLITEENGKYYIAPWGHKKDWIEYQTRVLGYYPLPGL
ncbi:HNH endonuclease [Pseudomonas sp. RL]|uniref:HNH endonuclease n=1 Tax=Pseudomonas sp. RL TaxID=1452718 RepID=UPI0012DF4EC4|nr:HNH endonuclease [Pseudomonas sp. RL]